ncbi:ArsR/SmtB family transcription factor [Candidatus Eisenbacteria bacterium]|uniref:ArsR/SmtB family transcription factor n=1 Tax=Eiseniibacteriota bacterium TaxID=2212470 RepID=A0ABV6YIH2_UNCEI
MRARDNKLMAYKRELYTEFARLGRAVSNPGRLEIVNLLHQAERSVEDLVRQTGRTHSNISQHLAVLKDARLVTGRKEGLFVYYRLADGLVGEFWQMFRRVALGCMADAREVYSNYARDFERGVRNGDLSDLMHVDELHRRLKKGNVVLLDVRPPVEFEAGHIPGAVSIPYEELKDRVDEIPRDREVIAYCRGPYCLMAREAVRFLESCGIHAGALEEGIPEWRAEGHEVEAG